LRRAEFGFFGVVVNTRVHTPRFWGLVAHYEPQWRELDRELLRGWTQVPAWVLVALRARARSGGVS